MTRNTTIGAALALLTLAAGSCLGQGTPCVGWYFTRTKEVSHPCSQFCAPHTHKWPALVKLKCDYATHACDGTVVRREDVTIVCVPREYGPRAHLVDSAGYSAAYYSLLRRFPEEQLQAMLRGQVVPEGAWPPSAKSVARRLFHKEAFVPSRVEMEVKSQAGLLAWLAEVHGRPPTAEEVVQMETAIDRSRRRQQAMQSLRRITAIGIRFDPAIDVSPPGKQPYAVPILLARPSATADSARRENAQGFLEPTPLSEEETYQLLDRVVDQAAAR